MAGGEAVYDFWVYFFFVICRFKFGKRNVVWTDCDNSYEFVVCLSLSNVKDLAAKREVDRSARLT